MNIFSQISGFLIIALFVSQTSAADNLESHKQGPMETGRLLALDNSLKHHSGSIISLRQHKVDKSEANNQRQKEGEFTDTVLFVLSEINNDVEDLIAKQNLLSSMESDHGKDIVAKHKNGDTKDFKAKCGKYLDGLNVDLVKIDDAALTYEVKSARDDVVKICEIVQNWE